MVEIIVPRECHQPANAFGRLRVEQRQLLLGRTDARIRRLEHREEHRVLVAEIVVKHPLVGLGARGDPVDACAAQPVAREFTHRGGEDDGLRARGIARVARTRRRGGNGNRGYAHASMLTSWLINRNKRPACCRVDLASSRMEC